MEMKVHTRYGNYSVVEYDNGMYYLEYSDERSFMSLSAHTTLGEALAALDAKGTRI